MQRNTGGAGANADRDPRQNLMLKSVAAAHWPEWAGALTIVQLEPGHTLYEPGQTIRHIHFPVSCVVSAETVLANGYGTQVAVIGYEGLVGMPGLLSGQSTTLRTVVRCGGVAARADVAWLQSELQRRPGVLQPLYPHLQAVTAQIAQTASCRRQHSPEEQLGCLLLRISDRLRGPDLCLTHDQLASLLGMRRETVTQASRRMQLKGLLRNRRAHMHILDRSALVQSCCECYGAVNSAYATLLQVPARA